MHPAIEEYYQAVQQWDVAIAELRELARRLRRAAEAIGDNNWRNAVVSGTEGFEDPSWVGCRTHEDADIVGSNWPTAQQISAALMTARKCEESLGRLYDSIPKGQRRPLISPDAAIGPMEKTD